MKLLPVLSLTALAVSQVHAVDFEPAPYRLTEGFAIIPQVETTFRYDDNIYNDESDKTSSNILLLIPSFKFGTDDGINQYGGAYELTSGTYSHGSADNFVDHSLTLLAHSEYTSKHRTDFNLGFANTHEDRGSDFSETDSSTFPEPLKYNELTTRGYYQFGGLNSIMRIGGGISYEDKTYQNFTDLSKFGDTTKLTFFADADYQFGSVTYLTFDLSTADKKYDYFSSKNNQDTVALVGVRWEGLAKTTGTMKVGYQHKTYDDSAKDNFSGVYVDLGLMWEPVQYSTITARVIRDAADSDTVGDYIETLTSSLSWDHHWTESFYSEAQYIYINEDYVGASRQDDTNNAAFYLNYDVLRWLKVKAGYEFTDKSSNADNISYDKNAVSLGVVVSL
tara:strand:+ start:21588 stop:22763 length:1176 start_codon:yes stop_codon:yes gene_type:complete